MMVSSTPYHDIRVRNYEADLGPSRIPLSDLLEPVEVKHIVAKLRRSMTWRASWNPARARSITTDWYRVGRPGAQA